MTAAILQGVPGTTIDIDIWIDLSAREYMRPVNVALQLGAELIRNTIVALKDGTLINFVYEVTGLKSFRLEIKKAKLIRFNGVQVPVLPLESIQRSKEAIMRPKDVAHLVLIKQALDLKSSRKSAAKGKLT